MEYDYVIVGAGSAGCVLANRLSADPGVTVALVEAGGQDDKLEIRMPAGFAKLFKTDYDWNYTTAKQGEMSGRKLYWPRGRVIGGSSSLNAQIWTRGHLADFDGWAEDDGCAGWSAGEVLPYFARAEDRSGAGAYGSGGPIRIEDLRDPSPATAEFLGACAEAGLPALDDGRPLEPEGAGRR